MKESGGVKATIGGRFAAAFFLAAFLSMACQNPDTPDPSNPQKETPVKTVPALPYTDPSVPSPFTFTPAVFFLNDASQPTTEDTGRTGITMIGGMSSPSFLVSSEYTDSEPLVRFLSLSNQHGETAFTTVSLSFADGASSFPSTGQLVQRRGTEEYTANITFSEYDFNTQTFSLTYRSGEYGLQTFDNLVLNKEVFNAYQFSDEVNESQNVRMRNAVVAMTLWTALEIQEARRGLCAAVSAAALAATVVDCPPTAFAAAANPAGASLWGSAAISSATGAVAAGAALVSAVETVLPGSEPPPPQTPSITGNPGPAGGVLVDKRDSKLAYTIEVIPYTTELSLTFEQAAELNPSFGGYSGWKLPTHDELYRVYSLYQEHGLLRLEQISPLTAGQGFLWTGTTLQDDPYYAAALNLRIQATGDTFHRNFQRLDKQLIIASSYIRVVP